MSHQFPDRSAARSRGRDQNASVRRPGPAPNGALSAGSLAMLARSAGNRAVVSLMDRRRTGVVQRAVPGRPADVDVGFNPQDIAHRLVEAIDQKQLKSTVPPFQRHVDLPVVVTALSGRTPQQVVDIDAAYLSFEHRSLRTDLLAGGESGFPVDLTADQLTRVRALLDGTKAAAGTGEQAGDLAALNRLDAEAAELHHLLHGDLPDADIERVMTLLRRDPAANAALGTRYRALFTVELTGDLGRLGVGSVPRAMMLVAGNTTAADALKVSTLRGRVDQIDSRIAELRERPGIPLVAAAQIEQLRTQRRGVVGEIESRVELAGAEARQAALDEGDLAEPGAADRAAKDRMRTVLGGDVEKAATGLQGADATALRAVAAEDPAGRAAAHLHQLREAGTVTAAMITETLRGLREQAEEQTRQAMPLADPVTRTAAARSLAEDYLRRLPAAYDAGRSGDAPSFDRLVGGTGDMTDIVLNQALRASAGELDPVAELRFALAGDHKDLETVKRVLRGRTRTEIDEIKQRFPELETELFGRAPTTAGEDNQAAEAMAAWTRTGGKASGADRLVLEDYLQRPKTEGGLEEAGYVIGRAEREYQYALDNRGFTGWWRDHWGNEARALMDESITNIRQLYLRFVRSGGADAEALRQMRLWRATIRGDRAGYEKANAELRATFEAVAAFALQVALTALLTPAAAAIFRGAEGALAAARAVKMVRGIIVNTVTTIAANAAVQDDYGLAALEHDLLGSLGSVIGAGSVSKLSGMLGERFVTSLAGKELISAATTLAGIEATAALEGRGLTEDLSVRNFLIMHGQGKIAHAVTESVAGPEEHAGPARPGAERAAATTKATSETGTAADVAELPGAPEHVSMALPEPVPEAARKAAVSEHAATPPEGPPRSGEAAPTTEAPRDELGGRRGREGARADQAERAAEHPVDARTIRSSARPDARARRLAGEFTRLFSEWPDLLPAERQARLEAIANHTLRTAGAHPVTVELGDLRPDVGAEFNFEAWEITLDRAAVESGDLTAEQFAALSDSVAHEARHALHHFRGIRAALVEGEFDYNAPVDADAIRAAKAANAHGAGERLRPGDPAFEEALEVYRQAHGHEPGQAEYRRRVIEEKNLARARVRAAERDVTDARQRAAAQHAGSAERAAADRAAHNAEERLREAQAEDRRAHNAYVALPQETDAWRFGSNVRTAVREGLGLGPEQPAADTAVPDRPSPASPERGGDTREESTQPPAAPTASEVLANPAALPEARTQALRQVLAQVGEEVRVLLRSYVVRDSGVPYEHAVLTPSELAGACGLGQDFSTESLISLTRDAAVEIAVDRFQADALGFGGRHAFAVVRENGRARFIVDTTGDQFPESHYGRPASPEVVALAAELRSTGFVEIGDDTVRVYLERIGAAPELAGHTAPFVDSGRAAFLRERVWNGQVERAATPQRDLDLIREQLSAVPGERPDVPEVGGRTDAGARVTPLQQVSEIVEEGWTMIEEIGRALRFVTDPQDRELLRAMRERLFDLSGIPRSGRD
jgi:hypothetical protein